MLTLLNEVCLFFLLAADCKKKEIYGRCEMKIREKKSKKKRMADYNRILKNNRVNICISKPKRQIRLTFFESIKLTYENIRSALQNAHFHPKQSLNQIVSK